MRSLVLVLAAILASTLQSEFGGLYRKVADIPLGPRTSRFDYESLDGGSGRLFVSKMGAGELLVFDVKQERLVATLPGFPKVTGVLAVPALNKVYASVPGAGVGPSLAVALGMAGLSKGTGAVAVLDATTLKEVARVPAGVFPDGIAFDPDDRRIFISDELGGGLTVLGADDDRPIARIDTKGEVGNVQYDAVTKRIYVPVQSRNELLAVDPKSLQIVARHPLAGARHPHGLRIAHGAAIGYVACDENDRLLVVDLASGKVMDSLPLGHDPDVLADDGGSRLYVASESGVLSAFDTVDPAHPKKLGDALVGENAHSVAVDPATHDLFLPLRDLSGRAAMRILVPAPAG